MNQSQYTEPIREWPEDEKPREKLLKSGEHQLSNTELLAILLRSGCQGKSAIDLARQIIKKFGSFRNMSHTDIRKWKEIKGLGEAKFCQIKAAIEIGRRFLSEKQKEKPKIKCAADVVEMLMPRMRDLKTEIFKIVHLNSRNQFIIITEPEQGTVNQAIPIIREIFKEALDNFSSSIICVHNHPSGDPAPSKEDKAFTKALVQAGEILNVKVLDHIIIGDDAHYSFTDYGIL